MRGGAARDGGVETVGEDGCEKESVTKKGKNRRPVSVPASHRTSGIKRRRQQRYP